MLKDNFVGEIWPDWCFARRPLGVTLGREIAPRGRVGRSWSDLPCGPWVRFPPHTDDTMLTDLGAVRLVVSRSVEDMEVEVPFTIGVAGLNLQLASTTRFRRRCCRLAATRGEPASRTSYLVATGGA